MPSRVALNQVSLIRPGMASILMPNEGNITSNNCNTRSMSGTSMAAPGVAMLVPLMLRVLQLLEVMLPSFGIKIDAIPGRINETWFKATREGIYYGQCSELCGKDHAFMPIAVRVVSEQAFATWVDEAKKKWAHDDSAPTNFAAADQAKAR